jgi:hypothetical protein
MRADLKQVISGQHATTFGERGLIGIRARHDQRVVRRPRLQRDRQSTADGAQFAA